MAHHRRLPVADPDMAVARPAELQLGRRAKAITQGEFAEEDVVLDAVGRPVMRPVGKSQLDLEMPGIDRAGGRALARPIGAEIAQILRARGARECQKRQSDEDPHPRPPRTAIASSPASRDKAWATAMAWLCRREWTPACSLENHARSVGSSAGCGASPSG